MSFYINNACNEKSYASTIKSKPQHKSEEEKELQKKKQIISEKEGEYYCTYLVGEKGEKILLSKIPISQVEKQDNLQNTIESDEIKSCENNVANTARTALEFKQQMRMEAAHKKNIQEIMDILKGNIGISSNLNKHSIY